MGDLAMILSKELTIEEEILNVALCCMRSTEVKRQHNGRGRCATYEGNVDQIASTSRQLAEMVINFFFQAGDQLNWVDNTKTGAETVWRGAKAETPLGSYQVRYHGDGETTVKGLDLYEWCNGVEDGKRKAQEHYKCKVERFRHYATSLCISG